MIMPDLKARRALRVLFMFIWNKSHKYCITISAITKSTTSVNNLFM